MKQSATFDSSFWINAHRAGLLPFALSRYVLFYPPAVAAEMLDRFPSGQEFWRLARSGTLGEVVPQSSQMLEFGPGERGAIDLALDHSDWLLLIDDHRPFQAAALLGLQVVCSPVLAVALFTEGAATATETLGFLARLAVMQTVSPTLLAAALAELGVWMRRGSGIGDGGG